tara:strand:- start:2016 stop:2210 length:195 start_codon:yes stop_codon:yes gene_type:complete
MILIAHPIETITNASNTFIKSNLAKIFSVISIYIEKIIGISWFSKSRKHKDKSISLEEFILGIY